MFLPAGYGNTDVTSQCSAGYYCPGGQYTPTPVEYPCWPGHYCAVGSIIPQHCPNGTFQLSSNADNCDVCPPSYYCDPYAGQLDFVVTLYFLDTFQMNKDFGLDSQW